MQLKYFTSWEYVVDFFATLTVNSVFIHTYMFLITTEAAESR